MNDQVQTGDDLAADLRKDAINARLKAEARLHEDVVTACKKCFQEHPQLQYLFADNECAAGPTETLGYWRKRIASIGHATDIIRLLEPTISAGSRPIFAAVSFCTQSAGPTLFLPVPYESFLRGGDQFFTTSFLINSDQCKYIELADQVGLIEAAARSISHALVNLSYSARIDDTPVIGWLAESHKSRSALYLPDVSNLPDSRRVISVSTTEELFLGVASILFLPLYDPTESKEPAPAVLVLWSPTPGRWRGDVLQGLGLTRAPEDRGADEPKLFVLQEYPPLMDDLWGQFGWLGNVVAKDESDVRRAELEVLSFLLAMEFWAAQQGVDFLKKFKHFFQGSYFLIEAIKNSYKKMPTRGMAARDWIREQLTACGHGFVHELLSHDRWERERRTLHGVPVLLEKWTGAGRFTAQFRVGDPEQALEAFLSNIPSEFSVPFADDVAMHIASEPANNIGKYAAELQEIQISLTTNFITLRYIEKPEPKHKERLFGTHDAFLSYYSTRRGLAPPRHSDESSSGLGLWLYRVFEAKMNVFWKLYVSPNGAWWHTDVAVRLVHDREERNE